MNIAFELYIQQEDTQDVSIDRQHDFSVNLLREENKDLFIDRNKAFEVER